MCVYLGVIYIYNYFQFLAYFPKIKVGLLLSPESFHARSSRGVHPTVSDFKKFGIQHLWTNITTHIFYFLHIGSRSVFTAL
jgi:hypothetical protein